MSRDIKVRVLKKYKQGAFVLYPNTIITIDYKIADVLEKGGYVTYNLDN